MYNMVVWRREKIEDVIVHSDQGSTYASGDYRQQLVDNKLRCSISRKGECLDNAVAESFFGSLNNERVYYEDYRTRAQARQNVFEYIEVFYNRKRRHALLDYMTPVEYEEIYLQLNRPFIGGLRQTFFYTQQSIHNQCRDATHIVLIWETD